MKLSMLFTITSLLTVAACTTQARLNVPESFAEMDQSAPYTYRAANAQGVVLTVRTEKNEPKGNVDFWADAIDVRMRANGYRAEAVKPVTSKNGTAGKQLRYTREEDRRTYRYWITVYVDRDRVHVVEAGGDRDAFDGQSKAVEDAVLTLKS